MHFQQSTFCNGALEMLPAQCHPQVLQYCLQQWWCFCLVMYLSVSCFFCGHSAQYKDSHTHSSNFSLVDGVLSASCHRLWGGLAVSQGNVWLRQVGAAQSGWFLFGSLDQGESGEQVLGPKPEFQLSEDTRNVWTPWVLFPLRRNLKPCPSLSPWTETVFPQGMFTQAREWLTRFWHPSLLPPVTLTSCQNRCQMQPISGSGSTAAAVVSEEEERSEGSDGWKAVLWQLIHSLQKRHLSVEASFILDWLYHFFQGRHQMEVSNMPYLTTHCQLDHTGSDKTAY